MDTATASQEVLGGHCYSISGGPRWALLQKTQGTRSGETERVAIIIIELCMECTFSELCVRGYNAHLMLIWVMVSH